MYTMVMSFPKIQTRPVKRPHQCPNCGSTILQKWGRAAKPLKDIDHLEAEVHRYRCTECRRTFRAYPPGIERCNRSKRLRALAAFTWALGLSLDSVVDIFQNLGLEMSRTTIWRDGQKMIASSRYSGNDRLVTILGIEQGKPQNGQDTPNRPYKPDLNGKSACHRRLILFDRDEVTVILKLGEMHIILGVVDVDGPQAAQSWLNYLANEFGMEVQMEPHPVNRLMN